VLEGDEEGREPVLATRIAALAATVLVFVAPAGAVRPAAHAERLDPGELQGGPPSFHDTILGARAPAAKLVADRWGGATPAKTGETVTVYVSDTYPVDPAVPQSTADFLVDLYHGSELGTLSVYVAPLAEVVQLCGGADAAGCYSPSQGLAVIPGADLPDGTSVETILAHEYGHHVAANRDNTPWSALDWGTKRWASYENVCARQAHGSAYPGDEGDHYLLNPGEGFAESFRLLNFERQSWPNWSPAPWNADGSFYPDTAALAAVRQDVLAPWTGPTPSSWRTLLGPQAPLRPPALKKAGPKGRVRPGRTRTLFAAGKEIRTPHDGELLVILDGAPAGTTISLSEPSGKRLVPPTQGQVGYTICGQRSIDIVVSSPFAGQLHATISRP
jgi:hypothetical protein